MRVRRIVSLSINKLVCENLQQFFRRNLTKATQELAAEMSIYMPITPDVGPGPESSEFDSVDFRTDEGIQGLSLFFDALFGLDSPG